MAELIPHPIERLATRMLRELDQEGSIFGLPRERFFAGDPRHDLSATLHGHRVGSPLGPAAGPHTQMAQNIVLCWLAGCRVFELKTVQVNDRLVIPRPCIDMRTVGLNVEWSQELRLEESAEEYVKAAMLIEILRASGMVPELEGYGGLLYDLSVGYDLPGVQTPAVRAFLDQLTDCRPLVERLRARLPASLGALRDAAFPTRLSDTVTLSTFHGCPPDQVEAIALHMMQAHDLHCVVKLNPTLLGPEEGRGILHDLLGYTDLEVPDQAYAADATWQQVVDLSGRLDDRARALGRGFGLKLTNTQIVVNRADFLPASEALAYLSGPPLHVLAMALVRRVRRTFGDRLPLSFSAGIDRKNVADALALGLGPVTACTDLLQPQGYGRVKAWFDNLGQRMDAVGAADLSTWTILAHGQALAALHDAGLPLGIDLACRRALSEGADLSLAAGPHLDAWVSAARLRNTEHHVAAVLEDPRYRAAANARPPRKVGTTLSLLDCLSCDKCLPACPNDANFRYELPVGSWPRLSVQGQDGGWSVEEGPPLAVERGHQIGNFVDFCNDCGNCDVFCPEHGGPQALKARFHGSLDRLRAEAGRDGLFVEQETVWARVGVRWLQVRREGAHLHLVEDGVDLRFEPADPTGSLSGHADRPVDLGLPVLLDAVRFAIVQSGRPTWPAPT